MSIPCLIVLMDVRVAPRLLLSSQNTHADPHKETPRNAVCTVCVCACIGVFAGVLLCWLQLPHSGEGLSKNSCSSELTEEGPASRQPGINHYSLSHTDTHTHIDPFLDTHPLTH